ncbi:MAG: hypothetical protein WCT14_18620 [Treponemataceae bacterium]
MRKLVLLLMGLIAISTFISAYNNPYSENSGDLRKSSLEKGVSR